MATAPRSARSTRTNANPFGANNFAYTVKDGVITFTMRADVDLGESKSGKTTIAARMPERFWRVPGTNVVIPAFYPYHDAKFNADGTPAS